MAKTDPFDLLEEPEILAEPVRPDAAIEFWQQRAKLTWNEAKALVDGAKARAFYVAGLYQQDLISLVAGGIEEALKNGETLEDFKKRIAEAITAQGWKDYRVETIFRTNMQTAYAAGRYRKMQAVKKTRPYWQYLAIMDKRTRPSHAILHEKVWPADHDFWSSNYPPNGFRCRCAVATLSERQVRDQGLTVETEMPKADMWTDPKTGMEYFVNFPGADNGFRNNPFKEWGDKGGIDDLPGLKDFKQTRRSATPKPQPSPQPGPSPQPQTKAASKPQAQPQPQSLIKEVQTNAELGNELMPILSQFTRNGPVNDIIFEKGKQYFMATNSAGKMWVCEEDFSRCNNFNPARDLKNAWNKIAKGQPLTFNEEYSLESLWHETVHNRETLTYAGDKHSTSCKMMETVTQWVARRTYPKLMEKLGAKPAHQKDILAKGYGYGRMIRNFDKLRETLGIADDDEMLQYFEDVIEKVDRRRYLKAITDYFVKKNKKVKKSVLNHILENTNLPEWEFINLMKSKLNP